MINILLADDHAIVRQGLVQLLSGAQEFSVIAEASNYSEVMRHVRDLELDAVVLDISMPGKTGIETLQQIKREKPRLPVLMLSMYPEDQYAVRAIKAGASGYLTKMSAPAQLVEALKTITQGRKYITPELATSLAENLTNDTDLSPHETLSDREFQTLKLIAAGKKLSAIADELALSPKTVSVYRARLMEKLRMKTNAELTRYALENNLID